MIKRLFYQAFPNCDAVRHELMGCGLYIHVSIDDNLSEIGGVISDKK